MKKNLTMVNNILCAVLLIVTTISMLIPCWEFTAEQKLKVKTCRECATEVVLEEDETDLPEGYTCQGVLEDGTVCGATGKKSFKSSTTKRSFSDSASVLEFTWMAYKNKGLTTYFNNQGLTVNEIILAPFFLTICVIAGVIACLLNKYGTWQSFFPLIGGGMTLWSYLTMPIFKNDAWLFTVIASALLTVAGAALFAQMVAKIIKWFVVPVERK